MERMMAGKIESEEREERARKGCISCPLLYVRIGCRRMQ